MSKFLHCTSMNIVVRTLPQVLFATHLYSVWYLVILVMFNSFPVVIWPLLTFSQKTIKGGVPVVTLHSFVTSLPSFTVAFCTCSTAGGTGREKSEGVIFNNKSNINCINKGNIPHANYDTKNGDRNILWRNEPNIDARQERHINKEVWLIYPVQWFNSYVMTSSLWAGCSNQIFVYFAQKIWYQFSTNFCQALPIF